MELTKAERQEIRSWANAKIIDGAHIDDRWARDTMIALLDDLEQLKEDVADVSIRFLNKSLVAAGMKVRLELQVKTLEDEIVRLKREVNAHE